LHAARLGVSSAQMPVAIAFAEGGEPARIDYRVPLPGASIGRRIVAVDLDIEGDVFTDAAREAGESLYGKAGVTRTPSGAVSIDESRARAFFIEKMRESGLAVDISQVPLATQLEESAVLGSGAPASSAFEPRSSGTRARLAAPGIAARVDSASRLSPRSTAPERVSGPGGRDLLPTYVEFLRRLREGVVIIPEATWSGQPRTSAPQEPEPEPDPQLFIVERYGISSLLGDYGMGRTVKTFTLLPGESTTISLKTWQSSRESIEESSSIIDSHEQSARDRFANTVQSETTDRSTRSQTEKWHAEAEASASWGWGKAKVSGGASGEYQSGREQFARQASDAVNEHAAEASSKRELSVSSSSERTEETGMESLVERTITNANMRRVLNFVFRELNQTYTTKLHLRDIRIGFTNGRLNSWAEVPLSGLRTLLEELVSPEHIEAVAQRLLKVAGIVLDRNDAPVNVLERVTIDPDGTGASSEPAKVEDDGEFPAPTERIYYRFRRGPLGQEDERNPVEGVLLSNLEIVMRTDSLIVEALLGQADALDAFAMEIQKATAAERTLANRREQLLHETLKDVDDPERRAELAASLFGPGPEPKP
jgi:hypothetical protein